MISLIAIDLDGTLLTTLDRSDHDTRDCAGDRALCRCPRLGNNHHRWLNNLSLGVFPPNVDKGNAVAFVMHRLGIHKEQVMAIGDNFVDLSMYRYARIKVAMGNAPDEVKQYATVVAPENDAEGVAWALRIYDSDLERGSVYRLEHNPRFFLTRVRAARESLKAGKGTKIEDFTEEV